MTNSNNAIIIGSLFATKSEQYPLSGIPSAEFVEDFLPEADEGTVWKLLTQWTEEGLTLFAVQQWEAYDTEEGYCPYARCDIATLEMLTTGSAIHYAGDATAQFSDGATPRVLLKSRVTANGKDSYCAFAIEQATSRGTVAPKKAFAF